jgi:Arc/MetJ-type ribon-helix-helix transcriptional regulator
MVRTQIQLTEEQSKALKELAKRRGVSVAELIRTAVDRWLSSAGHISQEERQRRAIAAATGFETGVTDLARNHDAYFAESTKTTQQQNHEPVVV